MSNNQSENLADVFKGLDSPTGEDEHLYPNILMVLNQLVSAAVIT